MDTGDEEVKKSTELMLHFITWPFVFSAATEFLPTWLAMPICLIAAMFWLGTCLMIKDHKKEDDETK